MSWGRAARRSTSSGVERTRKRRERTSQRRRAVVLRARSVYALSTVDFNQHNRYLDGTIDFERMVGSA
jgi:hypothetical protein